MPLDIYSTRAQLAAIEVLPREYSFLYDLFAADMGAVEDEKAIYDFKKGVQRMAPFVVPGTGGVLMERDGYETLEIGFPTIAPERLLGKNDITNRFFGENVLGAMNPQQRAKKQMTQDLIDMRKAIQRRREWMVAMVLLTGKGNSFKDLKAHATRLPYVPSIVKELGLFPTDANDNTEGYYYVNFVAGERFPRRGAHYATSITGLGCVYAYNERGYANTNYGCRPRSLP